MKFKVGGTPVGLMEGMASAGLELEVAAYVRDI